ncbi:methionyl-tRNA formyltransferase [Parapedobacter koreensis]|uniref:Methionyl-tRNA formyltransferase n=1 Tax=Parapedobacter koreensis TaxID=332977 RepID=A0A1H7MUK7_9SPHI|nr:methionyl-tRNA formyltransferase [Parapedobacter koreensis]SEL14719.1 methionyl-tRNA formyltransferase [Parapedobacter koreensis]
MRIIFMGTPEFAVASLEALLGAGEDIVAVVTAPDKPAGRGQQLQQSVVKQYAVARGIPVLQPVKLRDADFLAELSAFKADLQVVVAFRMLPEAVWAMPPLGTINLHASLLPQYRGAAPINHAIINGEVESGVSTFRLQHEIDTGHLLFQEKVSIAPEDTAGDLHDKLMVIGANLLVKTVKAIASGKVHPISQDTIPVNAELRHAPKIFKEDGAIDWSRPVDDVYNLIRGLSPYPTAYTSLDGKVLKIFKAMKENIPTTHTPGTYLTDGVSFLKFACPDGYIAIQELQIAGKKRMDIVAFLRGYRPSSVTIVS